jgi:anti-sigma B factor antagonist
VNLRISTRTTNNVAIVDLSGRIIFGDETTALRDKVKELLTSNRQVVLNLGDVNYIDSSGLGTLVGLYSSARASGGDIKLASLTKRVRDLLQITKLLTVFDTHDDVDQAVRAFEKGAAA